MSDPRYSCNGRILALLLASLALPGCASGGGAPAAVQVLTLNYVVQTVQDAPALIASVQGGQTTIADLLGQNPCNLTADFSTLTPPEINPNGSPGQAGFSVSIVATDPVTLSTTNPASCIAIDELEIHIGDVGLVLALGSPTSRTAGRILLVDGRDFDFSEFFEARVTGYDSTSDRTSGSFRFINSLRSASNTLVIAEGSFAMTP